MLQKPRYLIMIFLVILIINFVVGFIKKWIFFDWFYMSYESSFILSLLIILPVLFVGFYLIGKKFDLKSNLKWSIISLFFGSISGYLLFLGYCYFRAEILCSLMLYFSFYFPVTIVFTFFIAFSGMTIANFRNNN